MEENKEIKTEQKATMSVEKVDGVITLMERVKGFIDKHGLKGTFTTLLTLFVAATVGYFVLNPGAMVERVQQIQSEQHNEAVKARLQADPKIRSYLVDMRLELHADRVYILETHNGGTNLTNLPFLYVDLTYAEPKTHFTWLEMEYTNLRLSRYPWAAFVYNHGYWFGDVSEIEDGDPELYQRLLKEGVSCMGMMMLYGEDSMPSGTLGVVYETDGEDRPSNTEIMRIMQKYSNILSALLENKLDTRRTKRFRN